MKTIIKNKQSYKKCIGSRNDEDIAMGDTEGNNEEGRDGDEEKRKRDENDQRVSKEDGNDKGVGFNEEKESGDKRFDGSSNEEENGDDDEEENEFKGNGVIEMVRTGRYMMTSMMTTMVLQKDWQ